MACEQRARVACRSVGDMSASARAELDDYVSLKSVYLAAKHLPDRVLHRRRREDARRRVVQAGRVQNILVVCYGNVCRSPYLEAVLRRGLPTMNVVSAGFVGPGRPVPENSLLLAGQRGLNLAEFRSRAISRVNPAGYDLVIVMDSNQARYLTETFGVWPARIVVAGDLDPMPGARRAIHDPWGQSIEVFGSTFDRLDRCAATLISLLRRAR
jgi:protein-tyrosine phosphatase